MSNPNKLAKRNVKRWERPIFWHGNGILNKLSIPIKQVYIVFHIMGYSMISLLKIIIVTLLYFSFMQILREWGEGHKAPPLDVIEKHLAHYCFDDLSWSQTS